MEKHDQKAAENQIGNAMTKTLDDLLALLKKSEDIRREDVGLGKNEIHPVAHRLKRETSDLFQDTSFRSGYRGVRSPDIRQALSYFEYGIDCEVKEAEGDDVEHSDEYYYLNKSEDVQTAEGRLESLDSETIRTMAEVLRDLDEDWLGFVQHENETIDDAIQADLAD